MYYLDLGLMVTAIISFATFAWSIHMVKNKKGAFTRVPHPLVVMGSFFWADHVVFGAFWTLVSVLCLILQDYLLFALFFSTFWLVRSAGETTYWFLQQFSDPKHNPPESFNIHKLFKGSSVWFVYQIFWQTVTVSTIITTLALSVLWVKEWL